MGVNEPSDFAEALADAMLKPVAEIGGVLASELYELKGRVLLLENAVRLLLREKRTESHQEPEPIASRKAPTLRSVE